MAVSKILLVDDEPDLVTNVKFFLESEGYAVETCSSGRDVLPKAQAYRPHLILLDVMMPGIDGFEVCRRLQSDKELQSTPVVMLTAMSHKASETTGKALGAVDYLTKPLANKKLLSTIQRLLG